MPGMVDTVLAKAIKALQDARALAAKPRKKNSTTGVRARAKVDAALKELGKIKRLKSLGPDPNEGPLGGTEPGP